MTKQLIVLLGEAHAGILRQDARGSLTFEYEQAWCDDPNASPVSVSMPLARRAHRGDVLLAYLWGLLPDNEVILDAWAKRFNVSARNVFGLLSHVGEDCAGAVRFVTPDRAETLATRARGKVHWLDESAIASRLRALRDDESAWRAATDSGQFSLGGAQPKTALFFDGKRWGIPSGRTPTTHILKPGAGHLAGHAENEHFCLALAGELGLPVARSEVVRFEDEVAIVVERYDRHRVGRAVVRVHQEDCCQALGVLPLHKYESEGGPGPRSITELLAERSRRAREDIDSFIAALAFNWAIAGTDAHAKNYSILIGRRGEIRLAPLYDVASFLPYAAHGLRKLKLAMKIGGKYRLHEIGVHAWTKLAAELGRDPGEIRAMLRSMCAELPDRAHDIVEREKAAGLTHPVLVTLKRGIQRRAEELGRVIGTE